MARNCNPGSMDAAKIKGKIVVCDNDDNEYSEKSKLEVVKDLGGVGLILVDDEETSVASAYSTFPMTVVSSKDASEILSYMNSTRYATILSLILLNKQAKMLSHQSKCFSNQPLSGVACPEATQWQQS